VVPPDELIQQAFLYLLMFTRGPYYSTMSFITEDQRYLGDQYKFLRTLWASGSLHILSDASSLQEHILDRQAAYNADRGRYPVYFDVDISQRLWAEPTMINPTSATSDLRKGLLTISDDIVALHRLPFSTGDLKRIESKRSLIENQLKQFPDMGITMSLLQHDSGLGPNTAVAVSLGKLLSFLHLKHYLESSGADILTGIPQLEALDGASTNFPIFDFKLFAVVSKLLGVPTGNPVRQSFLEFLAAIHNSGVHLAMVRAARRLIRGAIYSSSNAKTPKDCIRPQAYRFIEKIGRTKRPFETSAFRLEPLVDALQSLIVSAGRTDNRFEEYLRMTDTLEIDRDGRVLLVCAADVEMDTALEMAPRVLGSRYAHRSDPIGTTTVHSLGTHGRSSLYLCQVEAGDDGASSLRLALQEVIGSLRPDFIILTGICYGLRHDKQQIGGIVVSKQVQAFNLQRRTGVEHGRTKITLRGAKAEASPTLLDRSRTARLEWKRAHVEHELYMSGSVLSDDPKFVKELLSLQPEARAAEMEGHGIYAACQRAKVDWIIIKSICDWGMGKVDDHQKLAAEHAFDFVFTLVGQGGLYVP
jgi:nucleoside phosphorylase